MSRPDPAIHAGSGRSKRSRLAIAAWLLGLLFCIVVALNSRYTADLSAFLPKSPTREQQVLLDQLQDGLVSRLILIGLEGGDASERAAVSRDMAARLRRDEAFVNISNGEALTTEKDQAFLFHNRYLLSGAVTPERFSVQGMHDAMQQSLDLLASPAGMMLKNLLPRDPTAETLQLFEQMNGSTRPRMVDGAWASRDGERALLLAQTRAHGSDTDGQAQAMRQVEAAFAAARDAAGAQTVRMAMTGPGVFSVQSRHRIEREVTRLSIASTVIIATLLLLVYRSLLALGLGLLPVLSGALAGVMAVSLGFGVVHGITLGFGTTLIGEAVDYSIYLFVQSGGRRGAGGDAHWVRRFWPTIRLGVLTSISGFAALLLSSFPGLAQLGLYSTAGLVTAALVTRYVLPQLLPASFAIRDLSALGRRSLALASYARLLKWPLVLAAVLSCALLLRHQGPLWSADLSALSPVPAQDQATDARLRADLGAPDTRSMLVLTADSREAALQTAERAGRAIDALVAQGVLAAYENPARYLPSEATQRARQAALPEDAGQRLQAAIAGLPFKASVFAPFVQDVQAARSRKPITRADLDGSSLALAVDAMLFPRGQAWIAVLPLSPPSSDAPVDGLKVRRALAQAGLKDKVDYIDLKAELDKLYGGYLRQAMLLSLAGLAMILVLLALSLKSPRKVARVLLPLAAAVLVVMAGHAALGQQLSILHLVGLLLIVAVGSNYALFFIGGQTGISGPTLTSLLFANMTTVAGFGLLGFSQVPVLNAIGSTVGPGAVLALLFSAALAPPSSSAPEQEA